MENRNAPSGAKDTKDSMEINEWMEMEDPNPDFDISKCGENQPPPPPSEPGAWRAERLREVERQAEWLLCTGFPESSDYTATVLGCQGMVLANVFGLLTMEAMKDASLGTLKDSLDAALRVESQSRQTLQLLEKIRAIVKKEDAKTAKELKKRLEKRERESCRDIFAGEDE